jgi:hypothetical protein
MQQLFLEIRIEICDFVSIFIELQIKFIQLQEIIIQLRTQVLQIESILIEVQVFVLEIRNFIIQVQLQDLRDVIRQIKGKNELFQGVIRKAEDGSGAIQTSVGETATIMGQLPENDKPTSEEPAQQLQARQKKNQRL